MTAEKGLDWWHVVDSERLEVVLVGRGEEITMLDGPFGLIPASDAYLLPEYIPLPRAKPKSS